MKELKYIRNDEGEITYEEGGKTFQVPDNAKVSMNFWCFDPFRFFLYRKNIQEFLQKTDGIRNRNSLFPSLATGLFTKERARSKLYLQLPVGSGSLIRKMHHQFRKINRLVSSQALS